jgi:hypothetical protein
MNTDHILAVGSIAERVAEYLTDDWLKVPRKVPRKVH